MDFSDKHRHRHRHTLLICEDEPQIRELLCHYFDKEGYYTLEAHDGISCLRQIEEQGLRIDAVLLDVIMPGMDGYETLRRLRMMSTVPVLFLTACKDEEQKIRGLGLGADDYIVKPFSFREVGMRVQALIRRVKLYGTDNKNQLLVNGALILNRQAGLVTIGDKQIALNAKELSLLKLFMENLNQVFTKKQIYEAIWNDPNYDDGNTLMVHISHLREKIEDNPKLPRYIKTIRSIGYRMERES